MRRLAVVTIALGLAFAGSVALAQEHEGAEKKTDVEPVVEPVAEAVAEPVATAAE